MTFRFANQQLKFPIDVNQQTKRFDEYLFWLELNYYSRENVLISMVHLFLAVFIQFGLCTNSFPSAYRVLLHEIYSSKTNQFIQTVSIFIDSIAVQNFQNVETMLNCLLNLKRHKKCCKIDFQFYIFLFW